jgi:hypothetical protein
MEVNAATGEVTVELAGKTFRLHATMPRVADYQAKLGVRGFRGIHEGLEQSDARAVYHGLRALCSSGNGEAFDGMLLTPHMAPAIAAIYKALFAGLPEAKDDDAGN